MEEIKLSGPYALRSMGSKYEGKGKWNAEMPPFNGRHLWTVISIWNVANPIREQYILDLENLLSVTGPGCWWCEQVWHQGIGSKCPGPSGAHADAEVEA